MTRWDVLLKDFFLKRLDFAVSIESQLGWVAEKDGGFTFFGSVRGDGGVGVFFEVLLGRGYF